MPAVTLKSFDRWIPFTSWWSEPGAEQVYAKLVHWTDTDEYCIMTPYATLGATADASDQRILSALSVSFSTEAEAIAESRRRHPCYNKPEAVRLREYIMLRYQHETMSDVLYHAAEKIGHWSLPITDWALGGKPIPKEYRQAVRSL